MSNLTREEQHAEDLAMVKQNGFDLKHVHVQTLELCLAAVNQDGRALHHVDVQTLEICLAAVNQDGYALFQVKVQTEAICIAAVNQDGRALKYANVQTEEVCLAAVHQNPRALHYVKDKSMLEMVRATRNNNEFYPKWEALLLNLIQNAASITAHPTYPALRFVVKGTVTKRVLWFNKKVKVDLCYLVGIGSQGGYGSLISKRTTTTDGRYEEVGHVVSIIKHSPGALAVGKLRAVEERITREASILKIEEGLSNYAELYENS
jgi:hypothetical protein